MRILHAAHGYPPEQVGPIDRRLRDLAIAQQRAGAEVVVASSSATERGRSGFRLLGEQNGIPIYRAAHAGHFPNRWDHGAAPAVESSFRELLREVAPQIVHIHHWHGLTRGLVRAASRRGIPSVISLHDLAITCPRRTRVRPDEPYCELPLSEHSCASCVPREAWMTNEHVGLQIRRYAADIAHELGGANALVALGASQVAVMARFSGVPESAFEVVRAPGVEPFGERDRAERNGGPLRLAYWGNVSRESGLATLCDAVESLEDPDGIELTVWGKALDEEIEARLASLGKARRIDRRHDYERGDLAQVSGDVAVFPLLSHETDCESLNEALALRWPTIVSDRGCLSETVGAGGLTVPPGDAAELAAAIRRCRDEPELLEQLRAAIPAQATTIEEYRVALDAIYSRVLESPETTVGHVDENRDLEELEDRERLETILESQCRLLHGMDDAAEREVTGLRKDVTQSFSLYQAELHRAAQLEAQLEGTRKHAGNLEKQNDFLERERTRLQAESELFQAERQNFDTERTQFHEDRKRIDEHIKYLEWQASEKEKQAEAEQQALSGRLEDLQARLSARTEELQETQARAADTTSELVEARQSRDELQSHADYTTRQIWKLRRENRLAMPLVLPAKAALRVWDWIKERLPSADGPQNPPS